MGTLLFRRKTTLLQTCWSSSRRQLLDQRCPEGSSTRQTCLSRNSQMRPPMSEVVDSLRPILNLKDIASSSYFFKTGHAEWSASYSNGRNGSRLEGSLGRNWSLCVVFMHPIKPNGNHQSKWRYFGWTAKLTVQPQAVWFVFYISGLWCM